MFLYSAQNFIILQQTNHPIVSQVSSCMEVCDVHPRRSESQVRQSLDELQEKSAPGENALPRTVDLGAACRRSPGDELRRKDAQNPGARGIRDGAHAQEVAESPGSCPEKEEGGEGRGERSLAADSSAFPFPGSLESHVQARQPVQDQVSWNE